MKKPKGGKFFIVMVFIALFLFGFGLNILIDGGKTSHRDLVGIIGSPFRSAATWVKQTVTDFFSSMTQYRGLSDENEALRKRIAELEAELARTDALQVENERLRALTGIVGTDGEYSVVAADVSSVSTGGWVSGFTVNKGSADGVEKRDVVVSADGLVGKVTAVGRHWATVTTIIDPQIAVGAVVVGTGDVGMTEGSLSLKAKGMCRLSYLDANAVVNRGDTVRTSGLGGLYPSGIMIGTVRDIAVQSNGLTKYAVIEPAADLAGLRRVYILIGYDAEG